MLNNKTIMLTGGSGSLGTALTRYIFDNYKPKKVIIFSRNELLQYQMKQKFVKEIKDDTIRFFIGDILNKQRLSMACGGVDYIIHAGALKQIDALEYNPIEAIYTNIIGTKNVIECAIENKVKKVIGISTDKACEPISIYGSTKHCAEKLLVNGNCYAGGKDTSFVVCRYGNVAISNGSIIPKFRQMMKEGKKTLPLTDELMTRFWITLQEACELIILALKEGTKGEIFIPKIQAFKIKNLILAMDCDYDIIGIRGIEKIHETLITKYESLTTYDYGKYFIIYPQLEWWTGQIKENGIKVDKYWEYNSYDHDLLGVDDLRVKLKDI